MRIPFCTYSTHHHPCNQPRVLAVPCPGLRSSRSGCAEAYAVDFVGKLKSSTHANFQFERPLIAVMHLAVCRAHASQVGFTLTLPISFLSHPPICIENPSVRHGSLAGFESLRQSAAGIRSLRGRDVLQQGCMGAEPSFRTWTPLSRRQCGLGRPNVMDHGALVPDRTGSEHLRNRIYTRSSRRCWPNDHLHAPFNVPGRGNI